MTDQQTKTITIDGKAYDPETLSDKAKACVQHVADLDQKIGAMRFQLDQVQVARETFYGMLKSELSGETKPVDGPVPA